MTNKGITLITLIVYVVGFVILSSLLFTMNVMYKKETFENRASVLEHKDYNKLLMYMVQDTKNNWNGENMGDSFIFDDGTKYYFANNKLYRNDIPILDNVDYISFTTRELQDNHNKDVVDVFIRFSKYNVFLERSNTFVFGRGY